MNLKRFVLVGLLAASIALSSASTLAKEVANERASCVGLGVSDHASAGDFKGQGFHLDARTIDNFGQVMSGFASFHEGSHAACEPLFGQTRR